MKILCKHKEEKIREYVREKIIIEYNKITEKERGFYGKQQEMMERRQENNDKYYK
jgi:hypothetical protein